MTEIRTNQIEGVTASAAEINILDGATLTTTELNYVDGVTSAIQTQLNGKQASGSYVTVGGALGTPSSGTATNLTGTAAGLTAGDSLKINGVAVTGTPSVGQVPTATSGTAATWQTPSGGSSTITNASTATSGFTSGYLLTDNAGVVGQLENVTGTWTPSIEGITTPGTLTYLTRVGTYHRIGGLCFVNVRLTINSISGTAGGLRITGLPFTVLASPSNQGNGLSVGFYSGATLGTAYGLAAQPVPNTANINLYKNIATATTALLQADAPAAFTIYLSGIIRI